MNKDLYRPNEKHVASDPRNSSPSSPPKVQLTLQQPVQKCLETRVTEDRTTLSLDGISIVSFSPSQQQHIGRVAAVQEQDLTGYLFFNTDFFPSSFVRQKLPGSASQMKNLAKTFFTVNDIPHVALVQYLLAEGKSSEHYHQLFESIVQLAGQSIITVRPIVEDIKVTRYELQPGDILTIPPDRLHQVCAGSKGSITVPIKQTFGRKSGKDIYYSTPSDERIYQELCALLNDSYTSGNDAVNAFAAYRQRLGIQRKSAAEQQLQKLLADESYSNLRLAFDQLPPS